MSNEKRLLLCILLIFVWVMIAPNLLRSLGLLPPAPARKPPAAARPEDAKKTAIPEAAPRTAESTGAQAVPPAPGEEKRTGEEQRTGAEKAGAGSKDGQAPKAATLVDPSALVLGSATDKTPGGYRLEVRLDQKGAGVESVRSSRYDAEFEGRKNPHAPLELIRRDPVWPPSLALTISSSGAGAALLKAEKTDEEPAADRAALAAASEDLLDSVLWDVVPVPGEPNRYIQTFTAQDPVSGEMVEGQQVSFQTTAGNGVLVTKTFRLWQTMNGFEVEIRFDSPDRERTFSYNLFGPHGIPIEGEWYTSTFREVFFGTNNYGQIKIESHAASEIVKAHDKVFDSTALPLRFTGVENQYFASFLAPYPAPTSDDDRLDRETRAIILHKDDAATQRADVGVQMSTKPIHVGPNVPVVHTYRVFAGPKTEEALAPYGAVSLASYRKSYIPGASHVARYVITPTLSITYSLTQRVSHLFGGVQGNWGVAIILLTLLVKMLMFPLGRKQALMAQRTQALQPYLKELQEKYKDDKERQTRETLALYKKHGVNPVSGCIPALIQLPIFMGLWQALNSSVALRHSPFLWINDLAAPDMLFRFPVEVMFLGHWFNLLPILVVGLMLFQTKLFAPPPTTPEAETQQKMMKYMMVFMAVMFYKVPSGLGIYFITSSLWSIGERLLLPKISHAGAEKAPGETQAEPAGKAQGSGGNGAQSLRKPPGAFSRFMEKVLEEAQKDPTYRKMVDGRAQKPGEKGRKSDSDDRDRGKPRARPGRK